MHLLALIWAALVCVQCNGFGDPTLEKELAALLLALSPDIPWQRHGAGRSQSELQQWQRKAAQTTFANQVLRPLAGGAAEPGQASLAAQRSRSPVMAAKKLRKKVKGFTPMTSEEMFHPNNWKGKDVLPFDMPDFKSKSWAKLQYHLDSIPVFGICNGEEKVLQINETIPFFVDATRTQKELKLLREKLPAAGWRAYAEGLGTAFRQQLEGAAMVIPGLSAAERVGPDFGSTLPLFLIYGMHSLSMEGDATGLPGGTTTFPIFLDPQDAETRYAMALKEGRTGDLSDEQLLEKSETKVTTLPVAVGIVLKGEEEKFCGARFSFVGPQSSYDYVAVLNKELDLLEGETGSPLGAAASDREDDLFPGASR